MKPTNHVSSFCEVVPVLPAAGRPGRAPIVLPVAPASNTWLSAVLTAAKLTLEDPDSVREIPVERLSAAQREDGGLVVTADDQLLLASVASSGRFGQAMLLQDEDMRRFWSAVRHLRGEDDTIERRGA